MKFWINILARLPFWFLYRISDLLFLVAYYVVRYRREVVMENLKRSFPEKSERELRRIARKFYLNLMDVIIETIKSYHISREEILKRIHFPNPEVLEEAAQNGQSVLVMASHVCNWEWQLLGTQSLCHGRIAGKVDTVYQPLSNKTIDDIMLRIRGQYGQKPIPMQSAVREIVRRKSQQFVYGLAADQTPPPNDSNFRVTFLHQSTPFFVGTARIAELTQFPVLYGEMKRLRRGRYSLAFHAIASPPYEKGNNAPIERYVRLMEATIQENPSDWLWSHKRWKYA